VRRAGVECVERVERPRRDLSRTSAEREQQGRRRAPAWRLGGGQAAAPRPAAQKRGAMGEAGRLSIGLIADAQYADLVSACAATACLPPAAAVDRPPPTARPLLTPQDDGGCEGRVQRFREVPKKLRDALAALRGAAPPPALVLHLGDIINGNATQAATNADFELVASIFETAEAAGGPETLHVLGNHCLDAGRAAVCARLRIPSPGYYARLLPGGDWELLVLDTTEMSGHSVLPADAPQAAEAAAFLAARPLSEAEPQMQPWNGGVASAQLAWLEERLAAAAAAGRRVVVAGHHQVGAGAARPTHMAWNWEVSTLE
jgi:hypothetical protein